MNKTAPLICSLVILFTCTACRVTYSFSGTSIQPDVKTVTINFFEYKALKMNPTLANDLTEALKKQFKRMTSLEQVDMDGDLEISGEVTGYDVAASAITANEVAAMNKLTVSIKITFTNRLHPEDDLEQTFSQYEEYESTQTLDAVESSLCVSIVDKLVEDITNATIAQW